MSNALAPTLHGAGLTLRAPRLDDFEILAAFFASGRSAALGGPVPRDQVWTHFLANAGSWALRGYGFWHIDHDGRFIGRAGIYHPPNWPVPELGNALFDAADEGKGLATKAARTARDGARKLGITSLISSVGDDNPQSRALCERLGAVDEGLYETPFGPIQKFRHFGEAA